MIIDKVISIPPIEKRKCNGCGSDNLKGVAFYEFNLGIALCQECWDYYKNDEVYDELTFENIREKEVKIESFRTNDEGRIVGEIRKNKERLNIEKAKNILSIVFGIGIFILLYFAEKFVKIEEFFPIFMYSMVFCAFVVLLVQFFDFIYTTEYNNKQDILNDKNKRMFTLEEELISKSMLNSQIRSKNPNWIDIKRKDIYVRIKHNQLELISQKIDDKLVNGKELEIQSKLIKWTKESGITEVIKPTTINNSQSQDLNNRFRRNVKTSRKRKSIPQSVKDKVWNRDGGKCVECGSNENLEFDHIIPHSKGGANTYRNIQLLCEPCNRSKSAKIG